MIAKTYHSLVGKRLPSIFPNLRYSEKLPEPKLNGPRWVILKSLMSGVCGSDQNMLLGNESFSMEPYASFPCVMGHENVAEVAELGPEVKNLKIGDRVVVNPVMGCKVHERTPLCSKCAEDQSALCELFHDNSGIGAGMSLGYHRGTGGGWSEFFQAHESQIYKIDKNIPLERAVLVDPMASALNPIARYAENEPGEKDVIIYGAGTIGLLAVASIRALKLPWKVRVIYRYKFQADHALRLGADEVIASSKMILETVAAKTDSKLLKTSIGKPVIEGGVDVVFDCVGSPETIDNSLRMCRSRGTVVLVATGSSLSGVDPSPLWAKEVKIIGSSMSDVVFNPLNCKKEPSYHMLIEMLANLDIESLVTQKFPLEQYKQALRKSINKRDGEVVKVVFDLH